MSHGEYLYILIITAKPSRAVSPSVSPRVNTVVSLESCLYSVQDTMDVKARIQVNTMRAIKEEPKNTYYQFETKKNMELTLYQNTQEFQYVNYTVVF